MRTPAEVIEENNRQRYLARREAERRQRVTLAEHPRKPKASAGHALGAPRVLPHGRRTNSGMAAAVAVAMLASLLILAVIGAWALIDAVLKRA